MTTPRFVIWILSLAMMALGAGEAAGQTTSTGSGQAFPNKALRIVTSGIGGGLDFIARVIAPGLTSNLGQPVIVENRAVGFISIEVVAKAQPDGYTLLAHGPPLWIGPLLQKAPYDPVRDLSPITLVSSSPSILVVNPALPVKSVKELIALAKAKPGELNYGFGGVGGAAHLAAELFNIMAGVNIVRIPYPSNATLVTDLIAGRVQLSFGSAGTVPPHIKAGRLRALAVTSAQPSALFPGVPMMAASGVPGFESVTAFGVFAPAKTLTPIITRLNQEIIRVLNRPDVKEKFLDSGIEAVGSSPAEFAAYIKSDMTRMGDVIKHAGIRVE